MVGWSCGGPSLRTHSFITMKNCIIYLVCIVILSLFGIGTIRKPFLDYNIVNQLITQNTTPSSNTTNQYVTENTAHIPNVIKPPVNSLNEDLTKFPSYSEDFANFPSYSAAVHKQLFPRTSYVIKQSNILSQFVSIIAKVVGLNQSSQFASIIAEAAGLDQSSQLEMTRGVMDKTILILSANMAYADMTYNFLCRLAKISKTFKYVVIAQDASFYRFLQSDGIPSISGSLIHPVSTEHAKNFRTAEFNAISIAKIIATRIVLELGYNVLFSDVDIAWKKNPMPFLSADVDLVIQSNSGENVFPLSHEANTGFYFLRSNDRSIALLDETINRALKGPSRDDQTHFGNALRDWRISKKAVFIMEGMTAPWVYHGYRPFTFRILHPYRFQSGKVARASYAQKVEPPHDGKEQDIIIVHANYMVGHNSKVRFLKSHDLWDLNDHRFLTYRALWKSKDKTNKKQQKQDRQIRDQSTLDTLAQVCVNLVV